MICLDFNIFKSVTRYLFTNKENFKKTINKILFKFCLKEKNTFIRLEKYILSELLQFSLRQVFLDKKIFFHNL